MLAEATNKLKSESSKRKTAEATLTRGGLFKEAKGWIDEAVDGLRKAGEQDDLTRGLIARAGYWRVPLRHSSGQAVKANYGKAVGDLEEAREIAERGGMKLWLADYYLEAARLARSAKENNGAAEHCGKAKALIEECGYHRRDGEVCELMSDE